MIQGCWRRSEAQDASSEGDGDEPGGIGAWQPFSKSRKQKDARVSRKWPPSGTSCELYTWSHSPYHSVTITSAGCDVSIATRRRLFARGETAAPGDHRCFPGNRPRFPATLFCGAKEPGLTERSEAPPVVSRHSLRSHTSGQSPTRPGGFCSNSDAWWPQGANAARLPRRVKH